MNRREFIKTSAAGSTALGLTGINLASCAGMSRRQITILHTNDVHSHIDPFPPGHGAFPNMGGAARRAGLIAAIRRENPNTLLLDAGDIFQGTPYFNFYGGELEFRLMSRMDYQAATLGNHDFDNGIPGLLAQLPYANFQFVSANYDFTNTDLNGLVAPYTIRVVDGVRIGIFGLGIELDGLVMPDLFEETLYQDPYERALDMSRTLREEEACHLVICLSHLGFRYDDPSRASDVLLAQKTEGIDLIIGGHTHTFLEEARVLSNRAGNPVLVNQVGCYGVRLGRVDFILEPGAPAAGSGVSITV